MKGLSKKNQELIADLEFKKKYYFTREDVEKHFSSPKEMTNTIYRLKKKGRIERLNKRKYFLIPMRARKGKWTDHPLILVDEILNGENYFIAGWYAAYYWGLTDQVPLQIDAYTTQRQGTYTLLNKRFVFHRTTANRVEQSTVQKINDHSFKIISKEEAKKWIRLKN